MSQEIQSCPHPQVENEDTVFEVALKFWCWYCNKLFIDEHLLIEHQKDIHFSCSLCYKKFLCASTLTYHYAQAHDLKLMKVPNSLPNRNNPYIDVYGMNGMPNSESQFYYSEKMSVIEKVPLTIPLPKTFSIRNCNIPPYKTVNKSNFFGNILKTNVLASNKNEQVVNPKDIQQVHKMGKGLRLKNMFNKIKKQWNRNLSSAKCLIPQLRSSKQNPSFVTSFNSHLLENCRIVSLLVPNAQDSNRSISREHLSVTRVFNDGKQNLPQKNIDLNESDVIFEAIIPKEPKIPLAVITID